jgi:histidinol-phosphate aminotransferase
VVVDEAYCEFVEARDFPNGMDLIEEYPNLVVFRTFSKMYGLAGLRIGYLAGNLDVVNVIRRTCVVYSVNALAQEVALAAVDDNEHVLKTREMVRTGKEFLKRELALLGLTYVAGEGNYVMVRLPISDTLAYRKLMTQGVMVRTMTGFRFPNFIRVTIAKMEAMEAFIQALTGILSLRNKGASIPLRGPVQILL